MNENNIRCSIEFSVILTSELNQLRKENELSQIKITELLKEKEILQKIILSEYT